MWVSVSLAFRRRAVLALPPGRSQSGKFSRIYVSNGALGRQRWPCVGHSPYGRGKHGTFTVVCFISTTSRGRHAHCPGTPCRLCAVCGAVSLSSGANSPPWFHLQVDVSGPRRGRCWGGLSVSLQKVIVHHPSPLCGRRENSLPSPRGRNSSLFCQIPGH